MDRSWSAFLLLVFVAVSCPAKLLAQDIDPPLIITHPPANFVRSLDFSADSKTLAVSTDSGLVRLWDPSTGELRQTLDTVPGYPITYSARFNESGDRIAAGTFDGRLIVWDAEGGDIVQEIQAFADSTLFYVEFGDDDSKIFVWGYPGRIKAFDAVNGAYLYTVGDADHIPGMPTFVPNEREFFTTWVNASEWVGDFNEPSTLLRKWSMEDGSLIQEYQTPQDSARPAGNLIISPDGSHWYRIAGKTVSYPPPVINNWLIEVNPETFAYEQVLSPTDSTRVLLSFDFSPDGESLLCSSYGHVFIWDVESGTIKYELHTDPRRFYIQECRFSPDGKLAAAGGVAFDVHVWRLPTSSVREMPVAGEAPLHVGSPQPNPAYSIVEIPFELIAASTIRATLIDVNGREVMRIGESHYHAGRHSVRCDMSALPSGYYTCVLHAGEFVGTQSFHVVR